MKVCIVIHAVPYGTGTYIEGVFKKPRKASKFVLKHCEKNGVPFAEMNIYARKVK